MNNMGFIRLPLRLAITVTLTALVLVALSPAAPAQPILSPNPANLSLMNSLTQALTGQPQGGPLHATWRLLLGYEGGNYFIYPYGILKVPLVGNLDNGWLLKVGADGLMYEFNAGKAGKIQASAPAVETLLGYSLARELGSVSVLMGPQYRHTSYSNNFTSSNHYDDFGFKSEVSASGHWGGLLRTADMIHSSLTGSYTTVNEFYRVQGRPLLYGSRTGIQFGPEGTLLGNPDFRRQQYGVVVTGVSLSHNITLTAHGGYQLHESLASGDIIHGVYYGVSILIPFNSAPSIEGTEDDLP
jgi:hypothetical protein